MIKQRIKTSQTYKTIRSAYDRYERFIIPTVLVSGFILDIVTFRTIDLNTSLIILGIYLLLTLGTTAFNTIYDHRKPTDNILRYLRLISSIILQFSIGALLSVTVIFYSFGSALSISWPIILIVIGLMVANEKYKHILNNPSVQSTLIYFLIFVYCSLTFPIVFSTISWIIFACSGITAIIIVSLYHYLLRSYQTAQNQKAIILAVVSVYIALGVCYIANIIPPIPLAIREAGIYHNITRSAGEYLLEEEQQTLITKILPGKTINIIPGKPVYLYTAIFAPDNLNTQIIHHWQYYNPQTKKWETRSKLPFSLVGGRKQGFRGYSFKQNTAQGKWRVFTQLPNGQILGKTTFTIMYVDSAVTTAQIKK